ncbi:MAG: type II toxin-antitoxin system RelE/ParE family toxin [Ignavibacteria bacterium]|jgi:plasmid stabilization system protein ParE|nr:type II toxin-antitoxin system RelE/ParE family toxin [Ignavibacteria bacterium]MBK7158444.1 type II toxin-antitoxin system RelE/ParE family toxin [Ignavibacteria bacterium]MBK7444836.1 type II toxin-antitoxin system RelE/ParE family toxin [Ignavibacteria bacterium]MBK8383617.1 type II toxin-antitoxin system RelE/ParE family toxin [Ignavibacteria bacterium]
MVYNIVFSERASKELNSTLKYIEENWSFKVADEFAKTIDKKISYVKSNPYQYPPFKNKKEIRKCVVTEQISFFYRILNDEVQIITIFDTRQSPSKLKLK